MSGSRMKRVLAQNTRLWGDRFDTWVKKSNEYVIFLALSAGKWCHRSIDSSFSKKEVMKKHLAQISAATVKGRYAVVVMDGAGWHTDDIADDFHNLSILKLPPYSPELNPIEQVWSWLRQHHLANRCFEGTKRLWMPAAMSGMTLSAIKHG